MTRPTQDKFHIFLSHKHEDAELALRTKRALRGLSRRIEVFVSKEDLISGVDWNRAIKQRLAESHMLLLLFTTPARNWDWCLYEAGLFTRFEHEDVGAVVCLFDPKEATPRPLSNLQGVRAERENVKRFLKRLCKSTWLVSDDWRRGALEERIADKKLGVAAQKIVTAFQGTLERRAATSDERFHPGHRIVLDFADKKIDDRIPEAAKIIEGPEETKGRTLALFKLLRRGSVPWTWGELLHEIHAHKDPWRSEIDTAFVRAVQRKSVPPITATLEASDGNRYKPSIYSVHWLRPDPTPVGATILLDRVVPLAGSKPTG